MINNYTFFDAYICLCWQLVILNPFLDNFQNIWLNLVFLSYSVQFLFEIENFNQKHARDDFLLAF